jgi:transcription termination factor Rho
LDKVAGRTGSAWTWEGPHVTETTEATPAKRSGALSSKLLPELKEIAGGLGIKGIGSMKKAQLIEAIRGAQSGGQPAGGSSNGARSARRPDVAVAQPATATEPETRTESSPQAASESASGTSTGDASRDQRRERRDDRDSGQDRSTSAQSAPSVEADRAGQQGGGNREGGSRYQGQSSQQGQNRSQNRSQSNQSQSQNRRDDDGQGGSRRSRRRRGRDRDRPDYRERQRPQDVEPVISEDDVLVPVAGIVDILDNYAFVRTNGYLPGPNDVYVSLSMVRKYGLRKGDAATGAVRQTRDGERKEKFNPLVRLDTVNGGDVEAAVDRVDFTKLTPLYPYERLRLETDSANLIGRVIDIAAPIGKGQRGLIVSPSKAGKTMIMQSIANSITTNNPECHLMVVLVDERPEEVTDFERSVKGEVIASTFDRPASDHTVVAELAIERAKRLVELGHDVVVLLDGITRLGRAYNLAAPASGRILSGGVDSAALYPPKKFFGAARSIEGGGSLTILATALIESGSKMDEVIFEEFKGTGNMEIRLRRDFADKRLFPAIDAVQSGTRREELLMSKEELAIVWKLRRVLSGLDGQQALELLLERLRKTKSNIEFLMQVQKTTPGSNGDV